MYFINIIIHFSATYNKHYLAKIELKLTYYSIPAFEYFILLFRRRYAIHIVESIAKNCTVGYNEYINILRGF